MVPSEQNPLGQIDPMIEPFREAMARFPTGVVIVTTHDELGTPHGYTASSFCSVSLDPPLLLTCLARTANSFETFMRTSKFAVSILGEDHEREARRFASKNIDKFADVRLTRTAGGSVVLAEALAVVECTVEDRHIAGDHVILIGKVDQTWTSEAGRPAVYCDRAFHKLHQHA